MPAASSEKPVADKYAMDYYRRPLATRLWKRRWNWLTLLIALLVTASLYLAQQDEAFQAGPVSPAHVAAGATCKDCHDQAWQPALRLVKATSDIHSVSDAACRECHQVADHHRTLGTVGHACASCHQEHRGGQMLTNIPDSQCVSCHADLDELEQATNGFQAKIESFTSGEFEHPEFALLRNEATSNKAHGAWLVATFDKGSGDNASGGKWLDVGGLKFNHKVHLAKEGMLDADRKPIQLECAACHEEDASGEFMAPINYQQHCAACHPLRLAGQFESLGELPHREPETVRAVLRERLTQQTATDKKDSGRIPLLPKPTRLTVDQAKTVDQLLAQAEHAVIGLEAKGMCRKCHHVEIGESGWKVLRQPSGMPSTLENAWSGSSMVPQQWLQHGRFDHSSHRAVECEKCHQAAPSELTSDILLPSISQCRSCHGGVVTTMAKGVGDSCVMCHDFHTTLESHTEAELTPHTASSAKLEPETTTGQ